MTLAIPQNPALADLWAKSADAPGQRGESLAEHTAAVLEHLAALRGLRPGLGVVVGEPDLWPRLYWATFLHDWGKAASGFQQYLRNPQQPWGKRHEVLSLAFLDYVVEPDAGDWLWLAAAIASHHKECEALQGRYVVGTGSEVHRRGLVDLAAEVSEEVLEVLWGWLQNCGSAWREQLGVPVLGSIRLRERPETGAEFRARAPEAIERALSAYYEWVEDLEYARNTRTRMGPLLLRGLMVSADHAGSAHAPSLGGLPLPTANALLEQLAQSWGRGPFSHQSACAEAAGSIALVAPTGSGKTESALVWAANQRTSEGEPAPRLFYVLPYQASLNAMEARLAERFGEPTVGLQHGKARHVLYRRYLDREPTLRGAARAAAMARNLTDLLIRPIRVLTPYQLLKAFYRLRGYEACLSDLPGSLLICDEIHAYEVERLALILAMFGWCHEQLGCQFCFMSATFPALLREQLAREVPALNTICADPATQQEFVRHRVHVLAGDLLDEGNVQRIIRRVREGEATLVCCNTVRRAQEMRDRLQTAGLEPGLLHARFHARDRTKKEQRLQEQMGTGRARARGGVVLVATQVVEVSLDIDFDVLFTDLAPLDALLQRFGRVNRGRRVPRRDVFVANSVLKRPYDPSLLIAAREVLEREFGPVGNDLDESRVSEWLDEVYSGKRAQDWETQFRKSRTGFYRDILDGLTPFRSSPELQRLFYQAFDGIEVLPDSLREEYERLAAETPLAAAELLVPIRWGQFCQLRGAGKAVAKVEDGEIDVVDCEYSSETGLVIG